MGLHSLASAEPVPCLAALQDQLPNQAAMLKLKTAVVHPVLTLRGEQRSPGPCTQYWEDGWIFGAAGNGSGDTHCCVCVRAVCLSPTPTPPFFSRLLLSPAMLMLNCTLWSPEELPV